MKLSLVRIFAIASDRFPPDLEQAKIRPKLTSRSKPERIGDESLAPPFSPFVRGHIW
jgi:hypothetical protein